jgi:hypothetical protein
MCLLGHPSLSWKGPSPLTFTNVVNDQRCTVGMIRGCRCQQILLQASVSADSTCYYNVLAMAKVMTDHVISMEYVVCSDNKGGLPESHLADIMTERQSSRCACAGGVCCQGLHDRC